LADLTDELQAEVICIRYTVSVEGNTEGAFVEEYTFLCGREPLLAEYFVA
jgi:hypothetical protein